MTDTFVRVTLFVPGRARSESEWADGLSRQGLRLTGGELKGGELSARVEVDWIANDGSFGEAFSFGTVDAADVDMIDSAPSAIVLHCHTDLREGRAEICSLVRHLRGVGALAVRVEQSKVGWTIDRWLELMDETDPWSWHYATVAFLNDERELKSCGMHAFSLPDVCAPAAHGDREMSRIMTALNVYQLGEDPLLITGNTFAPDAETPRRAIERWPDGAYPAEHPCHNPYGVWRVGPVGGTGSEQPKLATVFMPALRAILRAREAEAGEPLSEAQVVAVRDGAACMTMEHADARTLERSRGYADLDPELAWEQWQIAKRD